MKKLMTTMLAVAVGVGLHAIGNADTGTSFEGLTGDAPYDIFEIDSAVGNGGELTPLTAGETYWVTNDTATLTVVAGTSLGANKDRPAQYQSKDQYRYLSIKTTLGNPVTRKVNKFAPNAVADSVNIGNGYYFDSLVKFTAFDEDPAINLDGGKLAVWLKENLNANDEPVSTNLVITAGFLDANLQAKAYTTNYVCTVPGVNLNDGAWHRVTVKAIDSIYKAGIAPVPGFVVFIDKNQVKCFDAKGIINKSSLTDNAYVLDSAGALFPSADQISADKLNINAVQFDGQGDVDDLVFTSTVPFDEAKDAEFFAINLGEHVTGVQGYINLTEFSISAATSIVWTADQTVEITGVTCEDTWMKGSVTNQAGQAVSGAYTTTAGGSITVNAKKLGATVTINNVDTPYETLAEAVAAANAAGSTCKVTLADRTTTGVSIGNANPGATIILDLAGNNIAVESGAAITLTNGTLIVTNSTETVGVVSSTAAEGLSVSTVVGTTLTFAGGQYNSPVDAAGSVSVVYAVPLVKFVGEWVPDASANWSVQEGYSLTQIPGTDPAEYTLTTVQNYTIKFVYGDNGATTNTQTVASGIMPTVPSAQDVAVEGKTFTGWDSTVVVAAADATYTAQYTVNSYTITFVYGLTGGSSSAQEYNYGLAPEIPGDAAIDGYDLTWSPAIETVKSNTTYTAQYTAINYTITYMYGENELSGLTPTAYTIQDAVTLPTVVDLGVTGVSFESWTNAQGEVVANWAAGAKTGNQTFYAKTTVTGSTSFDSGDGVQTFTIDAGAAATASANLPEGKTLSDAVSAGSSMTYAQAYALGLLNTSTGEVEDLDATIELKDGKVVVGLTTDPLAAYTITLKVYEKSSLTAAWPASPTQTYTVGSETATTGFTPATGASNFYKTEVVITNKQ